MITEREIQNTLHLQCEHTYNIGSTEDFFASIKCIKKCMRYSYEGILVNVHLIYTEYTECRCDLIEQYNSIETDDVYC